MGKEAIVEKILSDADAECEAILLAARQRAEELVAAAEANAERERAETQSDLQAITDRMLAVNAAAARMDGAKALLAEKRRVIDAVYERARKRLLSLGEEESLRLFGRLLSESAEAGDEIVFDKTFAYREGAARLAVVKERGLRIAEETVDAGGGFILRGKKCDKDLTYPVLLRADMEARQGELAAKLFGEE